MNCTIEKPDSNKSVSAEVAERSAIRPDYKTERGEDAYRVEVTMPGVGKAGVKVSVDDGVLLIAGTRSDAVPEGWRPLRVELQRPDYRLKLKLTDEIDAEAIRASVEAGVLRLDLPVREAVKPRLISVE